MLARRRIVREVRIGAARTILEPRVLADLLVVFVAGEVHTKNRVVVVGRELGTGRIDQLLDERLHVDAARLKLLDADPLGRPESHHHFVRDRCGTVTDIYLERINYRLDAHRSSLKGGVVAGCEVQLRGRCARCRRPA